MKYLVFINTTDSFEDCWIPFFTLFKKYWPEYDGVIYLNTEIKSFEFPGLNIISIQNNKSKPNDKITWSECLIRALNVIETDVILYLQDDYFFKDIVKHDLINKYVNLMHDNKSIDCIHLTDQAVLSENVMSPYEGLYPVKLKQTYRISCQAALWKKETLLKYVRPHENAWQFEKFGSKRGLIYKDVFFVVDPNKIILNQFEIIPYVFTGIIKGRWKEEVMPLFDKNKISIDYAKRGFILQAPERKFSMKILQKLRNLPVEIKSYLDLVKLKCATLR
jgi:hypothetical protein